MRGFVEGEPGADIILEFGVQRCADGLYSQHFRLVILAD